MDLEKIKSNKKLIMVIILIIVSIILIYINYNKNQKDKEVLTNEIINNGIKENNEVSNIELEEKNNICVHISGEVRNSGIVILEENCRIIDAIEAAGGLTEKADISCVNLAYILSDGIKINIPNIENTQQEKTEYLSMENGENIVEQTDVGSKTTKVNINTAIKSELETLAGVGPSTADKIIEYRKLNGKFNSIDEIKNVSGIGASKFEMMKNNITVK